MKSTGYENLTQNQLHSLFSSEIWNSLSFDARINICQEIENRYATENNVEPCTITHRQMEGAAYGWQSSQIICLNTSLVSDGYFNVTYQDENGISQTAQIPAMAPNWNILDTVYHEGTHGIQEATGHVPSTYISPDIDGDLYRIQSIEKEAYAIAQSRTLQAINEVENSSGKLDPLRNDYFSSIRNDSFQAALQDAIKHYNDPTIESTLQNVISDRENDTIPDNPSESYKAINTLCDNYGIHSSFDTGYLQSSVENSDSTMQSESSVENNIIHDDGVDDNISSHGFGKDNMNYIDDGFSSFDENTSSLFNQTDSYDDGLIDNGDSISSGESVSSDNDVSNDIE